MSPTLGSDEAGLHGGGSAAGASEAAAAAEAKLERAEPRGSEAVATGERPRVLVVCATRHGSTMEVAEAVAAELRAAGAQAEVKPVAANPDPAAFDAVLVAAPMIMGWHKGAVRYVAGRRSRLSSMPVAYLVTAMSLTDAGGDQAEGVSVFKDPWLVKAPRNASKPSYRERYTAVAHYAGEIVRATSPVRPVTIAFFGGSLDFTTMNLFEKLFVMFVVGATPGDARNWEAIRGWAGGLLARLTRADEPGPPETVA